jgi:hypothetical protein
MVAFDSRIVERRQQFKPAVDAYVARRRRESDAAQIRKANKNEVLTKRRFAWVDDQENATPANGDRPAPTLADLPAVLDRLRRADGEDRFEPTRALQQLITASDAPCTGSKVVEAGALPELVKSMRASPACALEACWAVINLASGESAFALAVSEGSLLPTLLQLFECPDVAVREHAVWAVANIAGDGVEGRDAVISAACGDRSGLQVLLETLVRSEPPPRGNGSTALLRTSTWALHNLARGQPALDLAPALPVLQALVFAPDEELLVDALWALVFVADGSTEGFEQVMAAEILGQVIHLLGHENSNVVTPALRLCLNVTASTDEDTAIALECGLAEAVKPLLKSPKAMVRQDAAMLLANVACGPPAQVEELLTEGLLEDLLGLMSNGPNNVRREAVVAIANACSAGSPPQLLRLLRMTDEGKRSTVQVLCERLAGPDVDTIQCVLAALRVMLEAHEPTEGCPTPHAQIEEFGLAQLEELQNHDDCSVSELAVFLCSIFGDDEMDDPDEAFFECRESFDFSI